MNAKRNGLLLRYIFGVLSVLTALSFAALSFYYYNEEFIIKSSLITFSFQFNPLSIFFIFFISIISIFVSIFSLKYGNRYDKNPSVFAYAFFFALSMLALISSDDMLTFLIFWELMSIFSFLLVIYEGGEESRLAGFIYFLMTHIGTLLITAAFIMLYLKTSSMSFDKYGGVADAAILASALLGFSIKAGIIPFHTWLPAAHPVAPANISAVMSGVMVSMAVYGIIKFLFVFGLNQAPAIGIIMLMFGALSALFGIMYALVQSDIKKLLAFSTIENMGIVFIGIGAAYWAGCEGFFTLERLAMLAALLHVVNHGLSKSSLFMGTGLIDKYTGTRDMEKLGGLSKRMGFLSFLFLAGVMSIAALPPLNGFLGEWYLYISLIGSFFTGNLYMAYFSVIALALLSLSGAIAVAAFAKLYGVVFLGRPRTDYAEKAIKPGFAELASLAVPVFLCFFIGIYPYPVISFINDVLIYLTGDAVINGMFSPLHVMNTPKGGFSLYIPAVTAAAITVSVILLVFVISFFSRNKIRTFDTWSCGLTENNKKAQHSGVGLSYSIMKVFSSFYSSVSEINFDKDVKKYFRFRTFYAEEINDIFEKYFYGPAAKFYLKVSGIINAAVNSESINVSLGYLFVALILCFVAYMFIIV